MVLNTIARSMRRLDAFQRGHHRVAVAFAVAKKFRDDRAGDLAGLVAYYGFICLIPLLMVAVTVLGLLTAHEPTIRDQLLGSTLRDFPVIGPQIAANVHGLSGSGLGLAFALLLALWSGLGVVKAFENAMNVVWNVPFAARPGFVSSTLRALGMLIVLGAVTLASTLLAGLGAGSGHGWLFALGFVLSLGLNTLLFLLAFRILTTASVSWSDVLPGALVGAASWTVLYAVGGLYISHKLRNASQVYGTFAIVIVLLGWLYLGAQITLYAAEFNVVRRDDLVPRSLVHPPLTEADRRVLRRMTSSSAEGTTLRSTTGGPRDAGEG
jgi:YihY family inner membrane protein